MSLFLDSGLALVIMFKTYNLYTIFDGLGIYDEFIFTDAPPFLPVCPTEAEFTFITGGTFTTKYYMLAYSYVETVGIINQFIVYRL